MLNYRPWVCTSQVSVSNSKLVSKVSVYIYISTGSITPDIIGVYIVRILKILDLLSIVYAVFFSEFFPNYYWKFMNYSYK